MSLSYISLRALFAMTFVASAQPATDAVVTLSVDGRASSTPSIAASGRNVAVAWSAATVSSTDIFVSVSHDNGVRFSTPSRVNTVPGDARVNGEMPPRVVLVPRKSGAPELVVVWTSRDGAKWKLLYARSGDDGRTFSAAKPVPGSDAEGARGWHSVAVDAKGRVSVIWLDHRETVAVDAAHKHDMSAGATATPAPKADPTARAALSQLYYASLDGTTASSITKSVCYCCKTTIVADGNNLYAVWRHVYPGSYRDMAFAMSSDRGKTFSAPLRISEDHWQIDGCPDNGPSLAIDVNKHIHVAWPSASDGKDKAQLGVFYAYSSDGKRFSERTRVPTSGSASHPQLVSRANGDVLVAWDEVSDAKRRVGIARITGSAKGSPVITPLAVPMGGADRWYPALATTTDGAIAVWVRQLDRGSNIEVARLR